MSEEKEKRDSLIVRQYELLDLLSRQYRLLDALGSSNVDLLDSQAINQIVADSGGGGGGGVPTAQGESSLTHQPPSARISPKPRPPQLSVSP